MKSVYIRSKKNLSTQFTDRKQKALGLQSEGFSWLEHRTKSILGYFRQGYCFAPELVGAIIQVLYMAVTDV